MTSTGWTERSPALPDWTWSQLEEALIVTAATPEQAAVASGAVWGLRKQAPFLPKTQVLREILILGWFVMDDSYLLGPGEEPDNKPRT